jgi:hypothetical protein
MEESFKGGETWFELAMEVACEKIAANSAFEVKCCSRRLELSLKI